MKGKTILIVEDEPKIAEAVEAYLKNSGYDVLVAQDGKQGLLFYENRQPDMVILDLMLPYITGEELCRIIRKQSKIPMIMLTAKSGEDHKIDGLTMGADDYMTKPFSPRELVARVNSLFRRCENNGVEAQLSNKVSWNNGDLEVDFEAYQVKKKGATAGLTLSEFKLLSAFVTHPNKTFTRDELIDIAFGLDFNGYDRTIDSHIKNLRSKIETNTAEPDYILTVRGVGYKFGGIQVKL